MIVGEEELKERTDATLRKRGGTGQFSPDSNKGDGANAVRALELARWNDRRRSWTVKTYVVDLRMRGGRGRTEDVKEVVGGEQKAKLRLCKIYGGRAT